MKSIMINAIPSGDPKMTHIIGRSQGYRGLAVNCGAIIDPVTNNYAPRLRTAWRPTPEQIADIVAGATIEIELINIDQHPPIKVGVGERPEKV